MKTRSGTILFIVALLSGLNTLGQVRPPRVDTLLQKLSVTNADTSKARILFSIGEIFTTVNLDSANYYLERGHKLAEAQHFDRGLFEYLTDHTSILEAQSKYQEALEYYFKNRSLAERINSPYPQFGLGSWHSAVGNCYIALGIYDSSIAHYTAALKIVEANHDNEHTASLYSNLAVLYNSMKQYEKASVYGKMAIAICRKNNIIPILENALINTGGAYAKLRKYDSALIFLREVETLSKQRNEVVPYAQSLICKNYVLINSNQFADVKKNAEQVIQIATAIGDEGVKGGAILSIAKYYLNIKDYTQARDSAQSALRIGLKCNQAEGMADIYQAMADIELASGNMASYHRYRDMEDSIREVITSAEIEKNAQEFEVKYSLSKKQDEIAQLTRERKIQLLELRQKNILTLSLVGVLLVILLTAFLYYRNYTQKKKLLLADAELSKQKVVQLEQEKQLSATQSVLQGQEEERTRLAKDLHDGLGGMLSGIKFSFGHMKENLIMTPDNQDAFGRSMDMLDTSIRELRRVAHNMMPESLIKFGLDAALNDQCNYINQSGIVKATYQSVGVKDAAIDKNIAVNVYRIVQELLNNVMKHAKATEVLVQLIIEGKRFSITVEDNGKGFDPAAINKQDGIGWANIRNRVDYLNGKMDIQSSVEKGTSVFIEFNFAA